MSPLWLILIVPVCIAFGWCLRVSIVRAQSGSIEELLLIIEKRRPLGRVYTEGENVEN